MPVAQTQLQITPEMRAFLAAANKQFGAGVPPSSISKSQIDQLVATGVPHPDWLTNASYKMSNTRFMLPDTLWVAAGIDNETVDQRLTAAELDKVSDLEMETTSMIPARDPLYVPDGCYFDIVTLLREREWLPHWVYGPTGGGKTRAIEQACAATGREFFRVQITSESDEGSLLGGFQLINGETRYVLGRAPMAMKRGGVLLLDEADQGKEKAMCLQPILENRPVYLSRANMVVSPAEGFIALATANTQGRGDDTGLYIGANVQNAAYLDRLGSMGIFHGYPEAVAERLILYRLMLSKGVMDEQFITQLVSWAGKCRENVDNGTIQHYITTRKLCDIVVGWKVYGDKEKVLKKALATFDAVTSTTMTNYYHMFDGLAAEQIDNSPSAAVDPYRW